MTNRESIESYKTMTSTKEFEATTREIVMEFMGIVPLSCPPTSLSFHPFSSANPKETNGNGDIFEEDLTDGRLKKSKSLKYSESLKNRTLIIKKQKLFILEEGDENSEDKISNKMTDSFEKSNSKLKLDKYFYRFKNLFFSKSPKFTSYPIDLDILNTPPCLSKPWNKTKPKLLYNSFEVKKEKKSFSDELDFSILRKDRKDLGGQYRSKKKKDLKLSVPSRDSHYIDVNGEDDIDGMVERKQLSPAALSLQRELSTLRLSSSTSPSEAALNEVAISLRAIADQVEKDHSPQISRAVGRLVNFEEMKNLSFESVKFILNELLEGVSPGWHQVVIPLLLSQAVAMTLLLLDNRSVVGRLVDYTTKFICDHLESFLVKQGGWENVTKFRMSEYPLEEGTSTDLPSTPPSNSLSPL